MRRGTITSDMLGFVLIIGVFVIVIIGGVVWRSIASSGASEVLYRYSLAIQDKNVQLLKDGFEKTAAIFSIEATARELGLHGGLSEKALEKSDTPPYVSGVSPPLMFETVGGERIPYWVPPSAETCGATKQRLPYLQMVDIGRNIGLKPLGGGKAVTETDNLLWNLGGKYDPYFKEVNDGKYKLHVLLQIFFMKPASVTVGCGDGCVAIERVGSTPEIITTDGIYEYRITNLSKSVSALRLNLTADEGAGGDGTNVARIKQAVISIYDSGINRAANELLTRNLNIYQAEMKKILDAKAQTGAGVTTLNALEGAFYRGDGADPTAIVWSPAGISVESEDYLGNDKLLSLESSGVTEDAAKIRYWTMYGYAEKFARDSEGLLKYRLWKALNTLTDTSVPSKSECSGGCKNKCSLCQKDEVPNYHGNDVYSAVDAELKKVASDYTAISAAGIKWSLSVPSQLFKSCDNTNPSPNSCDAASANNCNAQNLEHYEYKRGRMYSGGCCQCSAGGGSCSGNSATNAGKDHPPSCSGAKTTTCDMEYYHRYILKNVKVLVTITDERNKMFDGKKWVPLEFRFFVFVPTVDDNCCTGSLWTCSDYRASMCSGPTAVNPAL